jgi:ATP-binding cassette, subfamily B, multidrug efflux pump
LNALDALLDEEPQDSAFDGRKLLGQLLPYYGRFKPQIVLAVVLLLSVIGLGLLAPLLLGQVIDIATSAGNSDAQAALIFPVQRDRTGLLILALAFVAVVLLAFLLEAWLGFVMAKVGIAMVIRLKGDLFRKVLTLDPDFFRDYPPGRLIARVESDTESLKDLFSSTALQLLRATLTFVGIFGCMLVFDAETTLVVLPVLLFIAVSTAFFVRYIRKLFHKSRRYLAALTAHITEYVQGIDVVQHYDYGPKAEASLRTLQDGRYKADVGADFINYSFWGLFAFCEIAAAALVLWVGVDKIQTGTMTLGTLVIFLEYLRQVFMPIQLLSEFVSQIQRGFVSAGRLFEILGRPAANEDAPDAQPTATLGDAIRFEDVRFGYDDATEVLGGISFEIRRGQRVALVGPSGGGKSTIVKLLLRFYEPKAGRITLDGSELATYTRAAWRDRVSLVPQEVFLFPGTLGDNLTVFNDECPEDAVRDACRVAQATRLIDRSPKGLTAKLAERGANLSHGERQLVSFARAVVNDPELLVLDEATSSVDRSTEARIQASLEGMLKGRTALIVAHRLSTIRSCDQILVVKGGAIVERGTHDELWEQAGVYRRLAELQLAAEQPS